MAKERQYARPPSMLDATEKVPRRMQPASLSGTMNNHNRHERKAARKSLYACLWVLLTHKRLHETHSIHELQYLKIYQLEGKLDFDDLVLWELDISQVHRTKMQSTPRWLVCDQVATEKDDKPQISECSPFAC